MSRPVKDLRYWHFDIQQRCILLAAEYIAVSRTSAWLMAVDGEFYGVGWFKDDKIRDPAFFDVEQCGNTFLCNDIAVAYMFKVFFLFKDDIKGDAICPGIFGADRFCQFMQINCTHNE